MLATAGLSEVVSIDSAGTGDWHSGQGADRRTVRALADHGYDGASHRARQFERAWFTAFEHFQQVLGVARRGFLSLLEADGLVPILASQSVNGLMRGDGVKPAA